MKRFVPCLLLLPLLISCVDQERYYEPGYYPPPPPPRVEAHRHQQHEHQEYQQAAAPRVRVDHHQATHHGHNPEPTQHVHTSGSKVIVHGDTEAHY